MIRKITLDPDCFESSCTIWYDGGFTILKGNIREICEEIFIRTTSDHQEIDIALDMTTSRNFAFLDILKDMGLVVEEIRHQSIGNVLPRLR